MEETHGIKKEELDDLEKRCKSDTKATFVLGSKIEDFYYNDCGVPMKLTAASNALLLFKMKFFSDKWERNVDIRQELEFASYHGGRAELFIQGINHYHNYDINSCYLSVMRDCLLPDMWSSAYSKDGDMWEKYWNMGFQMIMDCDIEVPDCHLPVLPYQSKELKKLIFPTGTFRGVFTSAELAYALEIGLVKIIKCHQFVYYKKSKPYFREFANNIWTKRAKYKAEGNEGMDKLTKLLGNSLYGKFAQHKITGGLCKEEDYDGDTTEENFRPIRDKGGMWWLTLPDRENIPAHCFPAISSFVASNARIKLHRAMMANEENLIYVDTDSIITTEVPKGIKISKELGDWGLKVESDGIFYRAKFYIDNLYPERGANKGVKKKAEVVEETDEYIKFKYSRPLTFREAIVRGVEHGIWIEETKKIMKRDDKRVLLDKNGKTRPLKLHDGMLIKEG